MDAPTGVSGTKHSETNRPVAGAPRVSSQVLGGHIALWDFFCVNFSYVWVGCIFHAASRFGLEGSAFFD